VLRSPVLVAAFEGWNDAGDAATAAVEQLELAWSAHPLALVDPDDYYDYQVNRPTVSLAGGVAREVHWPTTRLSVCSPPGSAKDVVLVRGLEPNMRWRAFCAEVLGLARDLDVQLVVLLGALLADTPHTRPVPVSGTTSSPTLRGRLGLEPSRYEGPTGIVGVLHDAATRMGFESVSLWAQVPHYASHPPCPKATLALLTRLEDLLDVPVPVGDLPAQSETWQSTVDELAAEDDEMTEYIRSLERSSLEGDIQQASGEAIAREFERYLRRRGRPGPAGS